MSATARTRVALLSIVVASCMSSSLARSAESSKPDILLVVTDQFNPRCMGCAGDPVIQTPNLDRIARDGAYFSNCYTNSPVCMPARICLATGQYPHETGWWMNFVDKFPAERITLYDDLRRAGYFTSKTGKFHYFTNTDLEDFRDQAAYYREMGLRRADELPGWFASPFHISAYSDYLVRRGLLDVHLDDAIARFLAGQCVAKPSPLDVQDHLDSFVARRAIEFLQKFPTDKPFFHVVSFPGPHTPVDAIGPYAEMYDPATIPMPPNIPHSGNEAGHRYNEQQIREIRAFYYAKISLIDYWIGEILQTLKRRGTLDQTLIIFTADHGDMMGAHGRFGKVVFFEESVRIPLLARWPKRIPAGLRTPVLTDLLDVYATVVDAANGRMSETAHGESWLPVCEGKQEQLPGAVFSEVGPGDSQNYMIRAGDYKYWKWGRRESLYHLADDPYERQDLAGSEDPQARCVLEQMRKRLSDFLPTEQRNDTRGYKPLFTRIRGNRPNRPLEDVLKEWRVKCEAAQRASKYLGDAEPEAPAVK